MQRYLWQQAEGWRHAYDSRTCLFGLGFVFTALCGAEVTTGREDIGKWLRPTYPKCDREILERLGIP